MRTEILIRHSDDDTYSAWVVSSTDRSNGMLLKRCGSLSDLLDYLKALQF